jgi:hypothetical protein
MAYIHLVTGHADSAHVTADDAGSLNIGLVDAGRYVLNIGKKFACTATTNNNLRIEDGDILMQGRHIRIEAGETVNLTLENGTQGQYRNDLVVCRYTKEASGVEKAELAVIKGTPATSNPEDPAYTAGDIQGGDLLAEMPLYRIPLDGITVGTPVQLFTVLKKGLERESEITQAMLPKTGGTITGTLTQAGMLKLGANNYGTTLPTAGNAGRIFFKKV